MEETGEIQKNSSENKKDLIHVEIHVDHFKAKLNQLKIVDLKLQNKLKKLYKIHNQFSLLLNRGIEKKYNFTQKSKETIQRKIALPPLPHIQNDSISNLLSTLHGASPNKLKMYIRENGILKNLIFGESSVFNDQLLDALTRAPPDIQISFIEVIIEEISKCASIYSKFVHSFSKFIKDNDLISRFTDSKVSNENFYQPYKKMLKELAEILFSEKCTFVFYSDMNDNLFYPINNFFYAISIDNSLSGILFKSNTPQRFESPNNHSLFDVTTEQFVFDENKSILSVPIQLNESSNMIGIIVFSRQNRYSSADEVTIQKAALYLAPIFNLFRVFFISMTPNQYPQLFRSIASIRRSDNFLKTLQR